MNFGRVTAKAAVGILSAALLAVSASALLAQDDMMPDVESMSVDEVVDLRVELMKTNGGILRGAGGLSGEEAVAAARQIEHNTQLLKTLFPEGSLNDDSRALPVIWENWDDFIAILDSLEADAAALAEVAASGDQDAYVAAVRQVGSNCGACHDTYRAAD